MPSFSVSLSSSIAAMAARATRSRDALASNVTYRGALVRAVLSTPDPKFDLQLGGYRSDASFECRFLKVITPPPVLGEIVTLQSTGESYSILDVIPPSGDPARATETRVTLKTP
jgi:hypothetical protein